MKIRDLFTHKIDREITTVIKMDEPKEAEIAQELREYVVTPRVMECFLDFFEGFSETRDITRSPSDKIGVWIYGFFGSGKSHMAKVIGHMLRNPMAEGNAAIDIFRQRIVGLKGEDELNGYLTQVSNFFDNQVVSLQIKAEQDLINPDSISEILYRKYLESRGFSRDPWIGRLELGLVKEGAYDAFREKIQDIEEKPWDEVRDDYLIVRTSIIEALQAVLPKRYKTEKAAEKALDDVKAGLSMGATVLARELAEYLDEMQGQTPDRSAHLVFIVDEVGQFIGDDDQKLLELQSIAEEFGIHGKGRLWLIVTAQEKLEDLIQGVRRRRAEFAKILDRFDLRLELTSENIELVVEERMLQKRPDGESELKKIHRKYEGVINLVGRVEESNRQLPAPDEGRFVRDYPFLPVHFQLMQDAFAHIRSRGGASIQLTGGERSMIGVVQGVLASTDTGFADDEPGRIVALHEIFDQIKTEVPSHDRRSISEAGEHVPEGSVAAVDVLKSLFVLQQLDWVPCNLENISRLMLPNLGMDYQTFRNNVEETLTRLRQASYVSGVEGVYKYLSVAERSIEEDVATVEVKNNDIRREARKTLHEVLRGLGRLNYESGLALFDIRILADGEEIQSKGDITLEIYSPVSIVLAGTDLDNIRDVLSPTELDVAYWLPGEITDLIPDFRRLIQLDKVVHKRIGREQNDEEVVILRNKQTEAERLREHLRSALNRALYNGEIVFQGDITELDGKATNLNTIYNRELSKLIPHVYTKLHLAEKRVNEASIERILGASQANLRDVETELDLWDAQNNIKSHLPVVQEILDEITRRTEYGQDTTGRSLADYFHGVPYGWNPILLRIVLAALFRVGHIAVQLGGTFFGDPGPRLAKEALTKSATFNKSEFVINIEDGPDLGDRKDAQNKLDILFDVKVDDTTTALYQTIRQNLVDLQNEIERLDLRAQGAGLRLKETLSDGISATKRVLEKQRPGQSVTTFLKEYEHVKHAQDCAKEVDAFITKGRLAEYRNAKSLLSAVVDSQDRIEELGSDEVRKRVEDLERLIESREVVERWGDRFVPAFQGLQANYQKAYAGLYKQRTKIYKKGKEEIETYGKAPAHIEALIVEKPGKWSETGMTYDSERTSITALQYQIDEAKKKKIEAIAAIEAKKKKKDAVIVQAMAHLPNRITQENVDDFKKGANKLIRTVEKAIEDGKDVLLS